MPCFATLFALLVMAAVGLPPFGFFISHLAMLVQPSGPFSWGLMIVLLTWFMASWYFFRMMQRLLFGAHREGLIYQDLHAGEVVAFVTLLLAVLLLGIAPRHTTQPQRTAFGDRSGLETNAWRK
jgi:NADH-quinone oxidoreductase subunit M